eukprot:g18926.t1
MELRDPQACKRCEKIHVQYELMMTATGRTVSAAVQIVPYGAALVWSLLFIAYCLTYAIEYGVPFFKRMTSVAMMVYLFMGTFGLSEANLVDQGTYVILAGFTLSFVKAGLERFIPSLLSYGLSGVHWIISRAEGSRERTSDIPRTLTGQALSGATAATLVAGSALAAGWVTELPAIVIGASAGYAFSLLTLFINVLFEHPSPDIDEQVPKTIFQLMMKILATLLTGSVRRIATYQQAQHIDPFCKYRRVNGILLPVFTGSSVGKWTIADLLE